MFDIKDFYPSVLKKLLTFAKTIIKLDDHDKKIIHRYRISLLFHQKEIWVKKEVFDVSMGVYDGAEVCELIGIFLLSLPGQQYDTKHWLI